MEACPRAIRRSSREGERYIIILLQPPESPRTVSPLAHPQILLLAAAVSFGISWFEESEEEKGVGHFIEPMVIVLILVLNATVGVWMVRSKERTLSVRWGSLLVFIFAGEQC